MLCTVLCRSMNHHDRTPSFCLPEDPERERGSKKGARSQEAITEPRETTPLIIIDLPNIEKVKNVHTSSKCHSTHHNIISQQLYYTRYLKVSFHTTTTLSQQLYSSCASVRSLQKRTKRNNPKKLIKK